MKTNLLFNNNKSIQLNMSDRMVFLSLLCSLSAQGPTTETRKNKKFPKSSTAI